MYCKDIFTKTTMMLSASETERLFSARVLVFGVGGVGGAVVHMLARAGVQNVGVVDFDTIDISNINRQFVANYKNIGKLKVDEIEFQLKSINPDIHIQKYPFKLDEDTINSIDFSSFDYIVDCIDDINAKKLLIKYAYEHKIPILCAMGAGNRYQGIPSFEIAKIEDTSYDKIAKLLRKFCAQEHIKKLQVCYTKQKPMKFDCKIIGSMVYYVVNMASVMCAKVINDIIKA
ncbi:MAG: tRNA threonylcarbamoyladenosine dehydratase [Clostridiales bacterium]|nr:tRNA threonylcarbamoyladenosine dehydratase [Clostridiales bacterium]